MSSKKKSRASRPARGAPEITFHDMEYSNSGVSRSISTGKLNSGLPYQREVNERAVDRLVREWDDRLLDPITVSFRDGKFNVVDGQHRIAAMRKMSGGRDIIVPCLVYTGLTYEQEADLCYKLDKAKHRLSLSQSTNALAESGMDAEIVEIRRLMKCEGFVWALGKRYIREYEVVATRAVINAYRLLGGVSFLRMFRLLGDTWQGDPHSLTAPVINGLALFIKTYESELKDQTFVKRLSAMDPEEITRRGRMDFSTNNTTLRYARVFLEKYNGSRGGRRLPYRFDT